MFKNYPLFEKLDSERGTLELKVEPVLKKNKLHTLMKHLGSQKGSFFRILDCREGE